MEQTFRDRLLNAVSELFGEPWLTPICDDESLIDEVVQEIEKDGVSRHRLNTLLVLHGEATVGRKFFEHFFEEREPNIAGFEAGVQKFQKVAMMHFGNFRRALRELGGTPDDGDVNLTLTRLRKTPGLHGEDREEFVEQHRDRFTGVEKIDKDYLYLLGYATEQRLRRELDALEFAKELIAQESSLSSAEEAPILANFLDLERLGDEGYRAELAEKLGVLIDRKRGHIDAMPEARERGVRNTQRYLSLAQIDVYVAASMRDERDFHEAHEAIEAIFAHPEVEALKIRHFNPLLSYVDDDRLGKGLIESLMLKRCHAIVYLAQESDSFGKDSELASMLCQGKPAIVYVHKLDEEQAQRRDRDLFRRFDAAAARDRITALDQRHEVFRQVHPLSLQVELHTGLAHGVIVCRDTAQCGQLLAQLFSSGIETELDRESDSKNYLLKERLTGSVVRVITRNRLLTHGFWTYYFRGE